jgi:hypothetical protein
LCVQFLFTKRGKEENKLSEKRTKRRVNADFNVSRRYDVHADAIESLDRMDKLLPDVPIYKKITFAVLNLETTIIEKKIQPTDDLEARLDLLT